MAGWRFLDLASGLASVGLPLALVTSPITTFIGGESREVLPGWTISMDRQAVIALLLGIVLLGVAPYLVTASAAQGKLARVLLSPTKRNSAAAWPNADASSGTFTTGPSSGLWRFP